MILDIEITFKEKLYECHKDIEKIMVSKSHLFPLDAIGNIMVNQSILNAEKLHLAELLEAIQRCVYFLDASSRKLTWPLTKEQLEAQKKDVALFEALAAINERFAKLQDTLGAAMRHACILAGEPNDSFLKVLGFYEKAGVLESVALWQLCRTARNLAAHDYEIESLKVYLLALQAHPSFRGLTRLSSLPEVKKLA